MVTVKFKWNGTVKELSIPKDQEKYPDAESVIQDILKRFPDSIIESLQGVI